MSLLRALMRRLTGRTPEPGRVPRVLHQVWHDGHPPAEFLGFRLSWGLLHPDWPLHLWDFAQGRTLVADHYPGLLRLWDSLPKDVQRADVLRYLVLHRYGGLYADMDTEALRSFDGLARSSDFFCGLEAKPYPSVCNALLGSAPRHPILEAVVRWLHQLHDRTDPDGREVGHVFATTGSLMLTPLVLTNATKRTRVLGPEAFYPFSWAEKERCHDDHPHSWARHYWVSGWYEEGNYRVSPYWEHGQPQPLNSIYGSTI